MAISFDPAKRDMTLAERGLDFADAEKVFAGPLVRVRRSPVAIMARTGSRRVGFSEGADGRGRLDRAR